MSFQTGDETAGEFPVTDAVLRALSKEPRRSVIRTLDRYGRLSIAELATVLEDGDVAITGPTSDEAIATRDLLYHVHVPVLTDAELVALDEDQLSLTARGTATASWIESLAEPDPGAG